MAGQDQSRLHRAQGTQGVLAQSRSVLPRGEGEGEVDGVEGGVDEDAWWRGEVSMELEEVQGRDEEYGL